MAKLGVKLTTNVDVLTRTAAGSDELADNAVMLNISFLSWFPGMPSRPPSAIGYRYAETPVRQFAESVTELAKGEMKQEQYEVMPVSEVAGLYFTD